MTLLSRATSAVHEVLGPMSSPAKCEAVVRAVLGEVATVVEAKRAHYQTKAAKHDPLTEDTSRQEVYEFSAEAMECLLTELAAGQPE